MGRLKTLVAELQQLVSAHALPLDVTELVRWADKLKTPGGFGKLVASIFLVRSFHRSLSAPRKEALKGAASDLRRRMQDMIRELQRTAAA